MAEEAKVASAEFGDTHDENKELGKEHIQPNQDKVEVEVIDDTPAADKGRPPRQGTAPEIPAPEADDDLKGYSETVQQRIKRLRYEYHEERRAKEAALRQNEEAVKFARKVMEENERLKTITAKRDQDVVEQASGRLDAELASVQRRFAEALKSGEMDEAAKAQAELAKIAAQKEIIGGYRRQPERELLVQPQPQVQNFQQPQPQQPDPKAVDWLNKNRWFGNDEEMTGYAYGLHEKLIKRDRVDPRTDDYYKRIDEAMRLRFPEKFDGEASQGARSATSRTVVAPPARTGSGVARKVQIPASAAALAKRLGLTLDQYAEQYMKEYGGNNG